MGQAHRRRRLQAFRSHGLAALLRQVAQPASYPTPPRNSPVGPVTKKNEPLLTFKRGAPVHFAVSQYEVAMTTRLAGEARVLLPFNRGTTDGGAVKSKETATAPLPRVVRRRSEGRCTAFVADGEVARADRQVLRVQ